MKVAVRADSSLVIGSGHIARCLVLADDLREHGAEVMFICREHPGHLGDRIAAHGHELHLLPGGADGVEPDTAEASHSAWLGTSCHRDAAETCSALQQWQGQWLVVDHYAIDAEWERVVENETGARVMAIDGLASRAHDCEVVLRPSLSSRAAPEWVSRLRRGCRVLAGPEYVFLRKEFLQSSNRWRRRETLANILISFGGVDRHNATALALEGVAGLARSGVKVTVVAGCQNPHVRELRAACSSLPNAQLCVEPTDLAEIMAAADLAIGAGGTTMWERCALGLPAVLVATAPHERAPCKAFEEVGAVLLVGSVDEPGVQASLRDAIERIKGDSTMLREMSESAYGVLGERKEPVSEVIHDLMLRQGAEADL